MKPHRIPYWWLLLAAPPVAILAAVLTVPWIPHASGVESLTVRDGMPLRGVLREAAEQGAIRTPTVTEAWVRLLGYDQPKRGNYTLPATLSDIGLVRYLHRGSVATTRVTVPEGWTAAEIAAALESANVTSATAFRRAATNAALTQRLGIEAGELEGYLFPETYRFAPRLPAERIARTMVQTFFRRLPDNYADKASAVDLSMHEAVILASIIEKEAHHVKEMPQISAVFHNRLQRGMRLQADPTAIYRMPDYAGNLTRAHLRTETPYNTYVISGLPAGPIANPGAAALAAAVAPSDSDALYFVARADGTHVFARSYAEHRRNVAKYQLGR